MAYTTIDDPTIFFNTVLYTSNSGSSPRTISGVGFQPDWVWVKNRDSANYNHVAADSVRGLNTFSSPDTTGAELTNHAAGYISSATSDGFVITAGSSNLSNYDVGSNKQVLWNWKAGTSFTNDASATGIGTIDSSGSVNQDAGFSIVSYTATSGTSSIKHGLNTVPSVIILKTRAESASWFVGNASLGWDKMLFLNLTNAASTDDRPFSPSSGSDPTSSIFFSDQAGIASAGNMIAYCFAEKKGYSKFGSYTGNGSTDGTFVYTGFKPAFLITKRTDSSSSGDWNITDSTRNPNNVIGQILYTNLSNAEGSGSVYDFYSNGFKIRESGAGTNASGSPYIYMAFAESPFTNSNGIPNNAR